MRRRPYAVAILGTDEARRLRARRAAAQLLSGPRDSTPARIAGRLLAVQAQDLRAARLALRARGREFTSADVDRALTVERSLVVAWLCRGTLHLVPREDYPWLLGLTAPLQAARSRRRLGQERVSADDAERAVAIIDRALAAEGPLGRSELAARIAAHGIRIEGQATPLLLNLAAEATVAAIERGHRGVYNVVDDDPAPVAEWLPAMAQELGAKKPMRVPRFVGRLFAGEAGVVAMTDARGASNAKAKRELRWRPAHPSWRQGFAAA
jgi:hypothetical protein